MIGLYKPVALMLTGASFPTLALAADQPIPVAVAVPAPAATAETDAAGKIICKREATTGSFVKSSKVCRSRAEWNRLRESSRDEVRDYVDHGRGGSNGR